MKLAILPRPSLLTSVVVAMSVASGLAAGVLAAGAAVTVHTLRNR